ncbi:MAG: PucR family transcriptional regulator [Sporichthyaceae bacterium]
MVRHRRSGGSPSPAEPDAARVAALGRALLTRSDEIGAEMAHQILATVPAYAGGALVSPDVLRASCVEQSHAILQAVGNDPGVFATRARAIGRSRAAAGVPLTAVMDAFRLGGRLIWSELSALALAEDEPAPVLVRAATDMWAVLDAFTHAMSEGYRDEVTEQTLGTEARRSALVQALLDGRLDAETAVWDVARTLRLPVDGPYLVVAAAVTNPGDDVLPRIEQRLREAGVASAWRLEHDTHTGVLALPEAARGRPDPVAAVLGALRATSTGAGVGVSPPLPRLDATPEGLRLARLALRAAGPDRPVVPFEDDPLAIASVVDDDVMRRLAHRCLAGLDGLTARDRGTLLETLGAWLDTGSADDAAAALFVHPNTVRHRLRRIQTLTGRSLTEPRAVAELALAYETNRRSIS